MLRRGATRWINQRCEQSRFMLLLHAARGIQLAFGRFAGRKFRVTPAVPELRDTRGMLHVAGLLRGSQNCMAGSCSGSPRASLGERRKGRFAYSRLAPPRRPPLRHWASASGFRAKLDCACAWHARGMMHAAEPQTRGILHAARFTAAFNDVLVMPSRLMRRMMDAVACMRQRVSGSHVLARFFSFAAECLIASSYVARRLSTDSRPWLSERASRLGAGV